MLSILHRYVLRELIRSFIIAFVSLTSIMLLGALYKPLRMGLGFSEIGQLLPYMMPFSLAWVIPASLLTGCVMTYGRLAAENELQAVCTSGVPLRYMCYPALLVALVLTAAAVPLNDRLIPFCRVQMENVMREAFYANPFRTDLLGTFAIGNHKIYVEAVDDQDKHLLHNVIVIQPPDEGEAAASKADGGAAPTHVRVFRARRARYAVDQANYLIRIVLEDAQYTIVNPGKNATGWLNVTAKQQEMVIKVQDASDILRRRRGEMSTQELQRDAVEQQRELQAATNWSARRKWSDRLVQTTTEIHARGALAFSTLALAMVGVPLGIWMRRESKLASFAVAVLIFLVLNSMFIGGEGLALERRLSPPLALWGPDGLTGALGLGLLLRTFRR